MSAPWSGLGMLFTCHSRLFIFYLFITHGLSKMLPASHFPVALRTASERNRYIQREKYRNNDRGVKSTPGTQSAAFHQAFVFLLPEHFHYGTSICTMFNRPACLIPGSTAEPDGQCERPTSNPVECPA